MTVLAVALGQLQLWFDSQTGHANNVQINTTVRNNVFINCCVRRLYLTAVLFLYPTVNSYYRHVAC